MAPLEPAILTIFGITGDLAQRKLLPALYQLARKNVLPTSFRIVGVSRRGTTVDDVLAIIAKSVERSGGTCQPETMNWLRQAITMVDMDITDPEQYRNLKQALDELEDSLGICLHRLFYLAIPSALFGSVIERLGHHDLNTGCQHGETESRLLIEKPFGYDRASAQELIATLQHSFSEELIYRIDHYLAKETVQNILIFRFENPLFSGVWDGTHISHIMITAAEEIGIEGRVAIYEQMGALRDLIQSHLLQILALITMEQPATMDATAIHQAKETVLQQIVAPTSDNMSAHTVRGQYATYKQEVNSHHSQTETYAAVRLSIDNPQWRDVPMYIRTGKQLTEKVTEVVLAFRDKTKRGNTNYITIRIQPNEGIALSLRIKKPGFGHAVQQVVMDYCYHEKVESAHPDAYERVIVDVLRGDKSLFATSAEVLASWAITEPILQAWQANQQPLHTYPNNSWGPEAAANTLLHEVGDTWQTDSSHMCSVHPQ